MKGVLSVSLRRTTLRDYFLCKVDLKKRKSSLIWFGRPLNNESFKQRLSVPMIHLYGSGLVTTPRLLSSTTSFFSHSRRFLDGLLREICVSSGTLTMAISSIVSYQGDKTS